MATLVTGGTGYIASNVVRELAERGHEVVSLDIVSANDLVRGYVQPWATQVTWVEGDILDRRILDKVADSHDISKIVHAATYTPYGDVERADARRAVDINLEGTVNLLDMARRLGVQRFLYVSSIAVYQDNVPTVEPLKEDVPLRPRGIYHITKLASERLTQRYGELYGIDTVSVRFATNYGPMERVTPYRARMSLPYDWVGKALRGEYIEPLPFGRGITEMRKFGEEFPYVKDTAAGIGALMDAPALRYQEYNIGTGHPISIREMVTAIREVYPDVKIVEPITQEDASGGRGNSYIVDPGRMQEDLGFVNRYDLVSGLRDYIKWRQDFNFMD